MLRLHTSLSFGITTEKQHSHLHEKSSVGEGKGEGECSEGRGSEVSCGKGEPEKTDNNGGVCRRKQPPISPHPVVKVHGYKAQVKIEMRCDCPVEPFGWGEHLLEIHVQV